MKPPFKAHLVTLYATRGIRAKNREGFPVFAADRLEAVKWRNWKVAFMTRKRDWWTPPIKLGGPKIFDLITDPKEEYPATDIRNT